MPLNDRQEDGKQALRHYARAPAHHQLSPLAHQLITSFDATGDRKLDMQEFVRLVNEIEAGRIEIAGRIEGAGPIEAGTSSGGMPGGGLEAGHLPVSLEPQSRPRLEPTPPVPSPSAPQPPFTPLPQSPPPLPPPPTPPPPSRPQPAPSQVCRPQPQLMYSAESRGWVTADGQLTQMDPILHSAALRVGGAQRAGRVFALSNNGTNAATKAATGNLALLSPRRGVAEKIAEEDVGASLLLSSLISPRGGLRHPSTWPVVSRASFGW